MGLEGIISKRKDLPYRSGRGEHWLKIKCIQAHEFVILGYVPSTAGGEVVGSLVLGYYEDGNLVHAGRVGSQPQVPQFSEAAARTPKTLNRASSPVSFAKRLCGTF